MIEIHGKAGIRVRILADSINKMGNRLITYEIVYPRPIHSELLTHGMLVRNAASSRAIPFAKMQEQLTGRPVRFGAANKGMQDKGFDHTEGVDIGPALGLSHSFTVTPENAWANAIANAAKFSKAFYDAGYHKQIFNRLTEAGQMMKTVISGTEYDNFFWLRDHEAADPTLEELAHCMQQAKDASTPQELNPGEWHVPYVEYRFDHNGKMVYFIRDGDDMVEYLTPEEAVKVSVARCAAVSFRNEGYGLEKTIEVYARLVGDERKHASSFQHQATPMKECSGEEERDGNIPSIPTTWQKGISHMDADSNLWSAQFCGFIMNRKLIPGENYKKPAK